MTEPETITLVGGPADGESFQWRGCDVAYVAPRQFVTPSQIFRNGDNEAQVEQYIYRRSLNETPFRLPALTGADDLVAAH